MKPIGKTHFYILGVGILAFVLTFANFARALELDFDFPHVQVRDIVRSRSQEIQEIPDARSIGARKIVVFDSKLSEVEKDNILSKAGGIKIKNLNLVSARVASLNPGALSKLEITPGVLRIEDDAEVQALWHKSSQPAEVLPWGVDRIDADLVWSTTTADAVKVGIIDTGIELSHPDLKNNIKGGYNAINPSSSANDDNGHGTHVGGTVAAVDNTVGVIGVGPNIDLYAIKVLDRRGSGFLSDIIEGLDWAILKGLHVVNMSLGTSANIQSFHEAVKRVNDAGIVQVAAAGNNSGAVNYPAAYPEVIAVSAIDSADKLASFSSRGPEVDLAAPGVGIYSTYRGQTYRTLSGTSMAAPHVAGVAALVLSVPAKCDTNGDGACNPAEVQARLEGTAEDLGTVGKDNLYGSGLVDAYAAVSQ